MSRPLLESETLSPDDGLPESFEYRRNRSIQQKCKRHRAQSIRQGIDAYFSKNAPDGSWDDDLDEDGDDQGWYH